MKPETAQHVVGQYQQWLADTQLQLATANATVAELRAQIAASEQPEPTSE